MPDQPKETDPEICPLGNRKCEFFNPARDGSPARCALDEPTSWDRVPRDDRGGISAGVREDGGGKPKKGD